MASTGGTVGERRAEASSVPPKTVPINQSSGSELTHSSLLIGTPSRIVADRESSPEKDADYEQFSSGIAIGRSADNQEWIAALQQLADNNFAQLYRALWQSLELEDPDAGQFQVFVLAALEQYGDHAPGEVLAALIQDAPNSDIRHRALDLLAEASQELSVGPFQAALDDPNPSIRQSGRDFFDDLNVSALLDAVDGAARDRDQAVRLAALSTLEEMSGYSPVWEVAEALLDDADPNVRLRALGLLTYGDPQAAIDRLVLALGDPDARISEMAEALLAELEQGPS